MGLGYAMWDADQHLYEAEDAFTRHLPAHRRRDVYWITDERGHRHLVLDRQLYDYIPNPTFDPVAVAGAFDRKKVEPIANHPEYRDREIRLRSFDEQGVEGALLFPTLINGLEERIGADVSLYYDVMWAFNRWLEEEWGFHYHNRIFGAPLIPFCDVDRAVEMLEWAIGQGARVVNVVGAPAHTPAGYRSPADPMWDPFWARASEADLLVSVHAGANGYNRYTGDWTGHYDQRPFLDQTVDEMMNQGRPISDYFTAMVWHGAFARFPRLRMISVENRGGWVAPLLERFRHYWRPGALAEDPVEAFQRAVWVSPHWDDDFNQLIDAISVERVVAGSDWPHYNSLADPVSFAKHLDGWSADVVRKIMCDNLCSLLTTA
jgi:predicted TIM-barrel fold metal-dependent hydrolase